MSADVQIPWYEPVLDEDDIHAVRDVAAYGFVNAGPQNRAFEETLRNYFDVPHAILTPNGTLAIALSLMAAGVRPGDEVLVPDLTFIGTASAVKLCGAEVVLVDVDPRRFVMDPEDAERKITSKTRALIPVHLNGRGAPMDALNNLARERDLIVIEDAAEAVGSRDGGRFLGTLGAAGCFSMAPTKIVTAGQGGFVLTHDEALYENIVRLKDHGRLSRASDRHEFVGFNFKVTDLQAALALSQWRKLDARIVRAMDVDATYRQSLTDCSGIEFTERPSAGGYLMWPDFKSAHRNELVAHLRDACGIVCRPFWPPIHTQPAYFDEGAFPGADEACAQGCWLPCAPDITDGQIERTAEAVQTFFRKHFHA